MITGGDSVVQGPSINNTMHSDSNKVKWVKVISPMIKNKTLEYLPHLMVSKDIWFELEISVHVNWTMAARNQVEDNVVMSDNESLPEVDNKSITLRSAQQ